MKKTTAWKTLLRSPLKSILTFLLITAASFALFSRITDYAITNRESAKAKSFYSGVAALDNSSPSIDYYNIEPKPWPKDAQIEEFSSLPGVTLADTRYTTDGLVEDYKRVIDKETPLEEGEFILEGTFDELKEYKSSSKYLIFHDVTVHAGELYFDPEKPIQVRTTSEIDWGPQHPHSQEFFEGLKKGGRYLVFGTYSEQSGTAFVLGSILSRQTEAVRAIDGLGEDYLDTEEFAWYKGRIEAINQSTSAYDLVYTKDMRAIPYVNERRIVIAQGRPVMAGDTDACVVSELFLDTYGLSIGDKLHVKLGDTLLPRLGTGGTRHHIEGKTSNFIRSVELEIIGAYQFTDEGVDRAFDNDWSYGPATIFLPSSLLPIEIPEDYEISMGDFSVFVEDPHDLEAFQLAAETKAAEMNMGLRFSDGGWVNRKENFETGSLASFLTTVLYILGAALALLLAVYLYLGRNRESYAIMRTLGVPGKKAGLSLTLALCILSLFAIPAGGMAGLSYATYTATKTLAGMSGSNAPEGFVYILNAAIPAGAVILCLVLELAFLSLITLYFLWMMKKTPPLELLQENMGNTILEKRTKRLRRHTAASKQALGIAGTAPVPAGLDLAKVSDALGPSGISHAASGYRPLRHACAYILRHMQRSIRKTAVSLTLAIVLAAGIGTFVLAKISYQEACQNLEVKGRAMQFHSSNIMALSKSDLIRDIYYYNTYSVRVNGVGILSPLILTNDFSHYLGGSLDVTYAKGYDISVFEGTGPVCLAGQGLAEELGIRPGDRITLMSEDLYSFMPNVYDEEDLEFAIERAGKPYTVVGILKSEDADVNASIFASINEAAEKLYSQPFPVNYCEFTLADNGRLIELNNLLEEQKRKGTEYSPAATYHINSDLLEHTKRMNNLLVSLFPIAMAAALLIGLFGSGLVILQSAQEAAFLRILGVTKGRVRRTLVMEQAFLCIIGTALVAGVLALFAPELFERSADTLASYWGLYLAGCILGAFVAAAEVARHKALALLQMKE